jgi:hypothetical protein
MVPDLDEVRKGAVVVRKAVVRRDEGGKEDCGGRVVPRPDHPSHIPLVWDDTLLADVKSIL